MFLMSEVPLQTVQPPLFSAATGPLAETVRQNDSGRAVAGKLGRFQEKHFREFGPESFRWTVYMSRPGTNISICENVSRHSCSNFH